MVIISLRLIDSRFLDGKRDLTMYEKNTLSECEMVTMRCVWNLGKDATAFNVINMLDEDYGLVYKETTVYTFLTKLKEKGFLDTVRNGVTYYIPRISEKEYLKKAAKQYLDFWFHGNVAAAVKEIMEGEKLSRKDQLHGALMHRARNVRPSFHETRLLARGAFHKGWFCILR